MEHLFIKIAEIERKLAEEREASRARGEQFNVFAVCGVDYYEVKHSAIIAELLSPKGCHGQGTLFLEPFLTSFHSDFQMEGVKVTTEQAIPDGRIDIMITNSFGQVIIIENKIYAQDQFEQLKRYNKYARSHYKEGNYEILYLTLYGDDPSEASTGGEKIPYRTISYTTTILDWLEDCIKLCAPLPIIKGTLVQYQNQIRQLTGKDMNTMEQKEIFKLMAAHSKETSAIVNAAQNGYLQYVYETYCRKDLEEYAKQNGLVFHEQDSIYNGFYFQRPEWKQTCIRITREGSIHYIGVTCSDESSEEAMASLLHHKLECLNDEPNLWWPYGSSRLKDYDNWSAATDTIPAMIDGQFTAFIKQTVGTILRELQEKKCKMI